jgi:uncharacterized protein RhaS with RHS repeats
VEAFVYAVGRVASVQEGGEKSWYYSDIVGSHTLVLDGKGREESFCLLDAFGNVVVSVGERKSRYRYVGNEFDEETGLYYYGSRYCASRVCPLTTSYSNVR